ncbi:MAG: DUF2239 domain-containing protein [Deltaproteobacteria bacterium HGW-Deltaproteobacteria-17]|nr:MAG: DUF2239 domain-containing protein [Deltaproteobacteria bacterium HGW-Deltaproteobacteria-17]
MEKEKTYTAFAGSQRIVTADVKTMLLRTQERLAAGEDRTILIFEDATGVQIDFDLSGSPDEVLARLETHPHFIEAPALPVRTGPGRPKLGVVSREVSLLPRHWAWLEAQPSGCSATLRRLVEEARKAGEGQEDAIRARDAAGKFMWAMAGDLPGFEEASRALYAGRIDRLRVCVGDWPPDVRDHLLGLLEPAGSGDPLTVS